MFGTSREGISDEEKVIVIRMNGECMNDGGVKMRHNNTMPCQGMATDYKYDKLFNFFSFCLSPLNHYFTVTKAFTKLTFFDDI